MNRSNLVTRIALDLSSLPLQENPLYEKLYTIAKIRIEERPLLAYNG